MGLGVGVGFATPALDELEAISIVAPLYAHVREALGGVLELVDLEDDLVEEVLQLLVGVVDEQLLEAVGLELLEAEHVEQADAQPAAAAAAARCDLDLEVEAAH